MINWKKILYNNVILLLAEIGFFVLYIFFFNKFVNASEGLIFADNLGFFLGLQSFLLIFYSYYIFKYSETHMKNLGDCFFYCLLSLSIVILLAIVYGTLFGIFFSLMIIIFIILFSVIASYVFFKRYSK